MFKHSKKTYNIINLSRVLITLLFFLAAPFLARPLFADSYVSKVLYSQGDFIDKSIHNFSDSSFFISQNKYSNVFKGKLTNNSTNIDLSINKVYSENDLVLANRKWGAALNLNYLNFDFNSKITSSAELIDSIIINSPLQSANLSLWLNNWNNISVGIISGINYSDVINEQFDKKFKTTFNYGATIQYDNGSLFSNANYYKKQINATMLSLVGFSNTQNDLPYELIEVNKSASIGIKQEKLNSSISFTKRNIYGESIAKQKYSMPIIPTFSDFQISLNTSYDHISNELKYTFGNASINAYDSPEVKDRFLISDSFKYQDLYGNLFYRGLISLGLFGNISHLYSTENSYLDAYPFSSWTILKPVAYRFKDIDLNFKNLGLEFEYEKEWNKINSTTLNLKTSYAAVDLSLVHEEKKIIVILPFYTNDTKIEVSPKFFIGDILLAHKLRFKNLKLILKVNQLIPVIFNKKYIKKTYYSKDYENSVGSGSSGNGDNTVDSDNITELFDGFSLKNVSGGTTIAADFIWKF